jgi:hypothetical protein
MRVYRSDAGWQERGKDIRADAVIVSMSPPSYPSAWLHPCRARCRFTWQIIVPRIVIGGVIFEQLAGGGIGAAGVGPRVCGRVRRDLGLSAPQHLVRRDESDGAVQRDLVVSHILANQAPRIPSASCQSVLRDGELPSPAECRQPTPGSTGRSQPPHRRVAEQQPSID